MGIGRIIDTSSNNHPNNAPIDWHALARQGFTTAIVKATEGTGYVNPYYHSDMAGASAAGLQTCAYHFASMGDVNAEVAHFLSVAGNKAQVLDYETNVNVTWANSFLAKLGRPPDERMIYGSVSSLVTFYQQVQALAWPAAYGQGYPGWGVMWQFTSSADDSPAVPTTFDESSWHGTEDQYKTFFQIMIPPPPPDYEENPDVTNWKVNEGQPTEAVHVVYQENGNTIHAWQYVHGPDFTWHPEKLPTP